LDKIKTTHVGSLPRSNELSELLFKKDKKEKIDLVQFDEVAIWKQILMKGNKIG